ncbi:MULTISPECIES: replicative DNA helicase [Acidiphilium]|jgi:replicative DNA helicase|uniref:Replicative DNA helicase n=2 Tax=Acidiphilium TaxID=522 RepID=A5G2I1_ACICJ|nr:MULTISPECIES: replicative DNA helicase [Acidiphilium]MBU6356770.1 replicative DNA helicase [Rhodospirillales bacterium]ABQ32063.1 primary replicative DNA helicase [Acidiphilium cryptum JF-5]EGO94227.1 Replicative DNA helicase [Acidiphilium sp. PM]MBS3022744.1 replicative DNA helicase [Acidiphilium multivorum]BAJ82560.1 replicative DNA helicase [Acidiphilium multivorum AIU301]
MDMTESALLTVSPRLPPANLEAEQALLGALLANNKAYERVSEFLAPEHFADAVHGRIYEAIARRIEAGQVADPVTLRATFEHSGLLDDVGGAAYLGQLLTAMVGIINAGDYGRIIYDAWIRRQLIELGELTVNRGFGSDPELDGTAQIEAAEQALFDLATKGGSEGAAMTFETALAMAIDTAAKAFERDGKVSGLTTGLTDLDARTGGLHPSDLLILAGRPGMGKTALATKIAFGAAQALLNEARAENPNAEAKQCVAVFSLEMSAEQLATRLLAEEARVSSDRIRRGEIGQKDFDNFVAVSRRIARLPLIIDDTPAITLSALRTRCRRLRRTRGLALIVVDYLQLMRPAAGTRPDNRVLEISQITQGLKAIAKELSVPVIALSQLSRAVESREDKRPQLSDLRESGTIEQDADAVMFVYRDEYYLQARMPKQMAYDSEDKFQDALAKWQQDMEHVHNRAELILAKQRHGPTGKIDLFFEAEFTRFADLDTQHE